MSTNRSASPLQRLDLLTEAEIQAIAFQMAQRQQTRQRTKAISSKFEAYQQDILGFVENVLGDRPWKKQREILLSVQNNTYTAVRSCHGAGKTFTAARAALWFLQCFPGSVVITTAPSGRQVKD